MKISYYMPQIHRLLRLVALSAVIFLILATGLLSSCSPAVLPESRALPDSILNDRWYNGIVYMKNVYFYLNEDRASGYFFLAEQAVPEVAEVEMKETGGQGDKETGIWTGRCEIGGRRCRMKFEGKIGPDTVDGWLKSSWLTARRLKIPRTLGVFLVKEKAELYIVPELPERYREPKFGGVNVKQDVFYGMADGHYTSMPVEGEVYDYQEIILDALDRMFRSPAEKVIISIFTKDPTILADLTARSLFMDIYEPAGDTLASRPLLLMLHGGAFIMGDKRAPTITDLAEDFASKGYVVASIDYRLGFNPGSKSSLERSAYRAVQDARAALRYLSDFSLIYGIDPDYCFIAGSSAGAITALNTAFMTDDERPRSTFGNLFRFQKDLGGLDESGNEYTGEWKLRAVGNLWGAVHDTTLIDEWERIPIVSFHGDADDIVPFGHDYPFPSMDTSWTSFVVSKMYGSLMIDRRAEHAGIPSELHVFRGLGHEPQSEPGRYSEVMDSIETGVTGFFADSFFDFSEIAGPSRIRRYDPVTRFEVPLQEGVKYYWRANGGKIVSRNRAGNRVDVVWPGAPDCTLELRLLHPKGAGRASTKVLSFE